MNGGEHAGPGGGPLGGLVADFGDDLRRELHACAASGRLPQTLGYAYDLARWPG